MLQEYVVRNFEEAVELLNWGLENRVMGCTKMNATSSRSHTVLTVSVRHACRMLRALVLGMSRSSHPFSHRQVKQHGKDTKTGVVTTRRGKLIFVDLAGSERVRRTTSTYVGWLIFPFLLYSVQWLTVTLFPSVGHACRRQSRSIRPCPRWGM